MCVRSLNSASMFCVFILGTKQPCRCALSHYLIGVVLRMLDREAPTEILDRTEKWRALCHTYAVSLPAAAMAFSALPSCVDKVVIGCSSVEDVEDCIELCQNTDIPVSFWREAQSQGLLPTYFDFSRVLL